MRAPPVTEKLPCKLTDEEKARRSDELSREVLNHKRLELERSLVGQRLSKEIKASDRKIGDLAEEVRTGIVVRDVPVTERRDYEKRRVYVVRSDTGAIVSDRSMEDNERQAQLPWAPPAIDGPGDDDDDDDLDDDEELSAEH